MSNNIGHPLFGTVEDADGLVVLNALAGASFSIYSFVDYIVPDRMQNGTPATLSTPPNVTTLELIGEGADIFFVFGLGFEHIVLRNCAQLRNNIAQQHWTPTLRNI